MCLSLRRAYVYVGLIFLLIWTLFPIYLMIVMSIVPELTITNHGFQLLPNVFTDRNYRWVLQLYQQSELTGSAGNYFRDLLPQIPRSFLNSAILAVSSSVIGIAVASFGAYAFGRLRFRFKNSIFFVFLSSQMLPSIAIVIPYFTLLTNLGLNGTYQGLITTYLTLIIPLATWVLSGYFATLPLETERAARIDGATRLQAITKVIIPMARPGIVAVWLLSLILAWNELLFGLLIGADQVKPIQPLILQLSPLSVGSGPSSQFSLIGALMVISVIFPVVVALFFQRYISRLNIVDPVTVLQ
jgi:multiple sugar transport system permease protein